MNKELIFKIIDVKKYNKDESILDILAIFDNIINKYSRKLNGEDTKQDLYVFLIKLIKNIDELSIVNYEDKQVLSYFSKALKNEYIRLSKKNDRRKNVLFILRTHLFFWRYLWYDDKDIKLRK